MTNDFKPCPKCGSPMIRRPTGVSIQRFDDPPKRLWRWTCVKGDYYSPRDDGCTIQHVQITEEHIEYGPDEDPFAEVK